MEKLSPQMRPYFVSLVEDLEKPGERLATPRAEATLIENQHSRVTVRGFTLDQDEPKSYMGTGKGPTPTDFFISSVALCENVVIARYAALSGVSIESLETVASGVWDLKGLYGVAGADPSFRSILVETRIRSSSPSADVAKVVRLTHSRCPIHATLGKATDLKFRLEVNGAQVPL